MAKIISIDRLDTTELLEIITEASKEMQTRISSNSENVYLATIMGHLTSCIILICNQLAHSALLMKGRTVSLRKEDSLRKEELDYEADIRLGEE